MAKRTVNAVSHRDIVDGIRNKRYAPIYLLMGDESYYIDKISDFIADNILPESERDFNQQIIYCTRETNVSDIINSARRYPMMAERQVLIVKEAQNLLKIEDLEVYVNNPMQTTILVICYKNGSIDKRKKIVSEIGKVGVVYESKKLYDSMLPSFIAEYVARKNVRIDERSTFMLVENIGSDLNRMAGELDKLVITLPPGFNTITPELIEKNIGISKEYNNWELRNAIIAKDVLKANKIINYFEQNLKANPPTATVSVLFTLFANVMQLFYSPDKSERGMMACLGLNQAWQLRDYTSAMRNYTPMKTMQIIGKLRETDARLKGVNKGNLTDADVLKELIFFILH